VAPVPASCDPTGCGTGAVPGGRGVRKAYGRHEVPRGAHPVVRPAQLATVACGSDPGKSSPLKFLAGVLAAGRGGVRCTATTGC
jgi:ABC-type transporter Mla maintaining outer membrane lipid asymmetry ATPase subunit MlaF